MPELRGTRTEQNLRAAFASESQANRRYLYFAQEADVEGQPEAAALFRSIAEGETGHAFGHLDFLADSDSGDPVTQLPLGTTEENLKSAITAEAQESAEMYPLFAQVARDEGFPEVGEWMETLARAEESNARRLREGLENLR